MQCIHTYLIHSAYIGSTYARLSCVEEKKFKVTRVETLLFSIDLIGRINFILGREINMKYIYETNNYINFANEFFN